MGMFRILLTFCISSLLIACRGNTAVDFDTNAAGTAQELFDLAQSLQDRKRYQDAADVFAEVERQYPLDPLAIESQFSRALSYYQGQYYADAIVAFDRFLIFNSGHPKEIRAVYLRARSYYDEIPDVFRDQGVTRQAQTALTELIQAYPNTQEARDAEAKLVLVRDQLAGHNMVIGRTYQGQNRYLAAQNRFKTVVEDYPTTSQVPEAFFRLVETSLALGLGAEARRYGATLGHNFPSNIWYHRAYALLNS